MRFEANDLSELKEIAQDWLRINPKPVVCLLNGEMGSGKTTFVKSICSALGVGEGVSSPTFSIVNEYRIDHTKSLYHFDLYRVKTEEELYDIGFEEYLDQGNYVFIEWPEVATSFFNQEEKQIKIEVENGKRVLIFS